MLRDSIDWQLLAVEITKAQSALQEIRSDVAKRSPVEHLVKHRSDTQLNDLVLELTAKRKEVEGLVEILAEKKVDYRGWLAPHRAEIARRQSGASP